MSTRQPGDFALHQDNRTRGLTEVDKRVPWIADDSDSLVVKQEDGTVMEFFPGAHQPSDSDLTAIATLATTAFGRALLTLLDAAGLASAAGLGKLNFPAWAGVGIDGPSTANRGARWRTDGKNRYAVVLGPDTDAIPVLSHNLYNPDETLIDAWATVIRALGGSIYLGGSFGNPRAVILAGPLKQGASEVERISANGEFSGKFNVFGGNEVILANGYNNALGQLYINYRGGLLPIANYKICDGMGAGLTANLTAKSFVKDGGLPTQLLLADGTTKPVSDFSVVDPNSLGPVKILDGSLTFATAYPPAAVLGAAANFPVNFWRVGKVVEISGWIDSQVNSTVLFYFNSDGSELSINGVNPSAPDRLLTEYRLVLICTAITGGNATIRSSFYYTERGVPQNGFTSNIVQVTPVNKASSFYVKATGAAGTISHVGAIAKMWS